MADWTKEEMIGAIRGSRGVLAAAARRLGCDRKTVYNYMERHPEVKAAIEEERDTLLDDAEDTLYNNAIKKGDTTSLIFLLKTIGKRRGYVERQEITGADGKGPIAIQIVNQPNDE